MRISFNMARLKWAAAISSLVGLSFVFALSPPGEDVQIKAVLDPYKNILPTHRFKLVRLTLYPDEKARKPLQVFGKDVYLTSDSKLVFIDGSPIKVDGEALFMTNKGVFNAAGIFLPNWYVFEVDGRWMKSYESFLIEGLPSQPEGPRIYTAKEKLEMAVERVE